MVYLNKFIAVIKSNNKILREQENNTVYLPFNTEYEILLKNLESRDASVKVFIDGQDILDGQSIILRANSSTSLEGFLKNNKVANKFKFIQKTKQISEHRGDRIDDGIVKIDYRFTKIKQTVTHYHEHFYHPYWCDCYICRPWKIRPIVRPIIISPPIYYSTLTSGQSVNNPNSGNVSYSTQNVSQINQVMSNSVGSTLVSNEQVSEASIPKQDEGITVRGSRSNQSFQEASIFELEEQAYTIVLRLRGHLTNQDKPVEKPVLVSTKIQCSTCGKRSDSKHKFCPECGTALY